MPRLLGLKPQGNEVDRAVCACSSARDSETAVRQGGDVCLAGGDWLAEQTIISCRQCATDTMRSAACALECTVSVSAILL